MMQDDNRYHRPLTARQERFAYEYCLDGNATAAARRAGYSNRGTRNAATTGARLLKHPEVRSIIEDAYRTRKTVIDGHIKNSAAQLKAQSSISLAEYLVIDHDGFLRLKSLAEMSDTQAAAVDQIHLLPDGAIRAIKLKDPTSAMVSLLKQAGIRAPALREDQSRNAT